MFMYSSWICLIVPWWRHQMETFSALLATCVGNSPVTGEFPVQRPVIFFICTWMNGWVNNREAGDLKRHRAHYNVTVMLYVSSGFQYSPFGRLTINCFHCPLVWGMARSGRVSCAKVSYSKWFQTLLTMMPLVFKSIQFFWMWLLSAALFFTFVTRWHFKHTRARNSKQTPYIYSVLVIQ